MWGQVRAAARVGSPLGLCRGLHASSRPPTSFSKILESRRHQIHTHCHRPSPGFSQLRDRPGEDFSSVPPLDQPTIGQGDTYRAGRFDRACSDWTGSRAAGRSVNDHPGLLVGSPAALGRVAPRKGRIASSLVAHAPISQRRAQDTTVIRMSRRPQAFAAG